MPGPLVTVICLCYNQGRFVKEAIDSVISQTHDNIQLLVVDDGSTDDSQRVIGEVLRDYPNVRFFPLSKNIGNCAAFNHAFTYAEGEYVIDLAADDVLMPNRIAEGIEAFKTAGDRYGVNFGDAWIIDEGGRELELHSRRFPHSTIPQGDVYAHVIERYFILSPTMMFRAGLMRSLEGYDETLAYEDFDILVRSSRQTWFCYSPQPLVKKRQVRNSLSQKQFRPFNSQLMSTYRVCRKIMVLNRTGREQKALLRRILYELRVCLRLGHIPLCIRYAVMWLRNRRMSY